MAVVWFYGMLLASSATTFGFFFIATGKLRLELLWRAQIDELTGLLNRWAFKRIAIKETFRSMRTRGRLATISMDLDGMKRVNDQMGHGGGDAVLQAVSASLQEALRDRDSIARMGGDEFCILLPDTEMQEALVVAERLRAQVESLNIRYRGETGASKLWRQFFRGVRLELAESAGCERCCTVRSEEGWTQQSGRGEPRRTGYGADSGCADASSRERAAEALGRKLEMAAGGRKSFPCM